MSTFSVIPWLLLILSTTKSCSPELVPDGSPKITDLELLQDANTVLLTINTAGTTDYFCKEMNINDGSVGDVISCDQDTRDFTEPDTDPTNTDVTSVVSNGDGTTTVTITRNDEELVINSLNYDKNVSAYSYFVLDDGNTLYVAIQKEYYENYLFGIHFESLTSNSNYTTFEVLAAGSWDHFDIGSSSYDILVYEDVKVIALPLVCCLCDNYFVVEYEINEENDIYNFSINQIGSDSNRIDATNGKVYTKRSSTISIYDLNSGQYDILEPDLSSIGSHLDIFVIFKIFSIFVAFCVVW